MRTRTVWAAARNLIIAGLGAYLVTQTLASAADTSRALHLDGSLDRAKHLAREGDAVDAAAVAREVLRESPRSRRALLYFVCYSWAAWDRDVAAQMIQRDLPSLAPETFQNCGSTAPLSQALGVATYSDGSGGGQVFVTNAGAAVMPSVDDARSVGPRGPAVWLALACRNLHAGLPGLAKLQVQYAYNGGIDVSGELGQLPRTWRCSVLKELR